MAHTVTAALVIAYDADHRQVYLYAGERVPDRVPADEVQRLVDIGMVVLFEPTDADAAGVPVTVGEEKPKRAPGGRRGKVAQAEAALALMSVDELLAEARARGIEVPEGVSDPADLIALIEQ